MEKIWIGRIGCSEDLTGIWIGLYIRAASQIGIFDCAVSSIGFYRIGTNTKENMTSKMKERSIPEVFQIQDGLILSV
jgi:hypothetical protein